MRFIYKIQFPNGKFYIGQTKNVIERMKAYKRLHCKDMPKLYYALKKYKFENCLIEILTKCDDVDTDLLERKYIKSYNTTDIEFGYNLDSGGCKNKSHSEETKRKIANSHKNKPLSESHKESLRKSHIGQPPWNKGKITPFEVREKISNSKKGKKQSVESRLKRSKAMKLYWKNKKNA